MTPNQNQEAGPEVLAMPPRVERQHGGKHIIGRTMLALSMTVAPEIALLVADAAPAAADKSMSVTGTDINVQVDEFCDYTNNETNVQLYNWGYNTLSVTLSVGNDSDKIINLYGGTPQVHRFDTALNNAPITLKVTNPNTGATNTMTSDCTVNPNAPHMNDGYWMVAADGNVYPFGLAGNFGKSYQAVDIEKTPTGDGYWILVNGSGDVSAFGDAVDRGGHPPLQPGEEVTSLSSTPDGGGYWLFTNKGRAFTYGNAPFLGDMSGATLNGPVLDSVATPDGQGYYMVASDGGVFSFGTARFHGSMGGHPLNAPVESLAPDPDGVGYWLVASDGGIFAFDTPFYGSMGGVRLNQPVSGMVGEQAGYMMVAYDGGIFAFGSTKFRGSLGGSPPPSPVVAVAAYDRSQ